MIKVYISFLKIHIVEVIVDLGFWQAVHSLIWLFSFELFDKSTLLIKMTSIQGWESMTSIRSFGWLESFFHWFLLRNTFFNVLLICFIFSPSWLSQWCDVIAWAPNAAVSCLLATRHIWQFIVLLISHTKHLPPWMDGKMRKGKRV